jgi:NADH-quinone oxidoreductase subunit H
MGSMDLWHSVAVFTIVTTVAKFAVIAGFVLVVSALLTWMERRQSAYMQDRLGPHRAHFLKFRGRPVTLWGLVHIIADSTKMLFKEPFMPAAADKFTFQLAPAVGFVSSLLIVAFIPFGPDWHTGLEAPWDVIPLQLVRVDGGLLWILAMGSLGIYGTALAGWSSNNKFALLGGIRASAQSISYEIALGLTLVGMLLLTGTSELSGMLEIQRGSVAFGWLPSWGLFLQPLGAVLFFIAAMAETKRAPFDMPEGESEIIGYFVEYSSMGFGLFMLGEFVEVVVLAAIFSTIFLGGWMPPGMLADGGVQWGPLHLAAGGAGVALLGMATFACKVLLLCVLQLQVRWTLPRFRYDQLMDVGWKMLLPLSLVNIAGSAALLWADPSLGLLLQVNALGSAIFALVVLAGPRRRPRPHEQIILGASHGH